MAIKVNVRVESEPIASVVANWQRVDVLLTGAAPVDVDTMLVSLNAVKNVKVETRVNGKVVASFAVAAARAIGGGLAVAGGLDAEGEIAEAIETALNAIGHRAEGAAWIAPDPKVVSRVVAEAIEKAEQRAAQMWADVETVKARILSRA